MDGFELLPEISRPSPVTGWAAIVAMVIVLAPGHDAALDRTPLRDSFPPNDRACSRRIGIFTHWTRNTPNSRLTDSKTGSFYGRYPASRPEPRAH